MGVKLSRQTIAKLKARAADPSKRSDTAAMSANSVGIEDMFAQQRAEFTSKSPEHQRQVREYLKGMNSPFASMISNSAAGDGRQAAGLFGALSSLLGGKQMFAMGAGGQTIAMTRKKGPTTAPAPATEAAVAATEAQLGFELPDDLRHFYLEVANGGVGPGDGVYSLAEIAAKWHELTDEPVGPRGQKWPETLLPIHGDRWDLTCIDRETGKLINFDPEELGYAGWSKTFKGEADSLDSWLARWLSAPPSGTCEPK